MSLLKATKSICTLYTLSVVYFFLEKPDQRKLSSYFFFPSFMCGEYRKTNIQFSYTNNNDLKTCTTFNTRKIALYWHYPIRLKIKPIYFEQMCTKINEKVNIQELDEMHCKMVWYNQYYYRSINYWINRKKNINSNF